ncbi:MAG: rhodanese-like domain-containing protein [Dehalococcoidia bacterium]
MKVQQFVTESLGDSSYLVVADGVAAAVDPQRDVRPFLAAAERLNVPIRYVFETHVHNDYVSGGRELAALGAHVVAPAEAGLQFPHIPLADGKEIEFGGTRLRAVAAPGHTYEHTAYLGISEKGRVEAAFTGGALLMGGAGRTDLLGKEHTAELTQLQWQTAQNIRAQLQPSSSLFPTHGSGSFCSSTGAAMERSGPLSEELTRNPAFTSVSAEEFAAIQLAASPPIPGYYPYMAPINRAGARVFGTPPEPPLLELDDVAATTATLIDVRPRQEFVAGYIPGTLEIEESTSFLAYVGWMIPFNSPIVLISTDAAQAQRVTVDLFRIGYEDVRGYLPFASWKSAGRPIEQLGAATIGEAREILADSRLPVVDTRFKDEQKAMPLPHALELPFDEFRSWASFAPPRALVVCASGQRATMAASALQKAGREVVALVEGGAENLL